MTTSDDAIDRMVALERAAQHEAERRIHACWQSINDEDPEADYEMAGAYCGCLTCDVREVLDAAWPYLYRLAQDPDCPVPSLPEDGPPI